MNSVIPIETAKVIPDTLKINSKRTFAIVDGGEVVTNSEQPAQSYSNQQVIFNITTVPNTVVDRKMFFNGVMQFTITCASVPGGTGTLLPVVVGANAPRAFPLSNIFQNISMKINNNTITLPLNQLITAMQRYNNISQKNNEFSLCPTYPDMSQNYSDLAFWTRNPLQCYGDSDYNEKRGAFPFTFTQVASPTTNGPASFTITMEITEEIQMSPLLFGLDEGPGFCNVDTLNFTFNLDSNLQRVWSIDPSFYPAGAPGTGYGALSFSNFSWASTPNLFLRVITPKLLTVIPEAPVYNYYSLETTTQDFPSVPAGSTINMPSQVVEFSSLPSKIYVFMRIQDQNITMSSTDTFFSLESLNVKFGNQQGVFSGTTKKELYNIARKNGCNLSWEQWQGTINMPSVGQGATGSSYSTTIGSVGSVFCFNTAVDMGLPTDVAPGVNGRYQFQLQTGSVFKNINTSLAIAPRLYIIGVQDGTLTLMRGNSINQIGVITKQDILDAKEKPYDRSISISQIRKYEGSSFFSVLKDINNYVKGNKLVSRGLNAVGSFVPEGYKQGVQKFEDIAKDLGYGLVAQRGGATVGGALVGGRKLTRAQMRNLMN
jgi:hypothetical protein